MAERKTNRMVEAGVLTTVLIAVGALGLTFLNSYFNAPASPSSFRQGQPLSQPVSPELLPDLTPLPVIPGSLDCTRVLHGQTAYGWLYPRGYLDNSGLDFYYGIDGQPPDWHPAWYAARDLWADSILCIGPEGQASNR